LQEEGCMSRSPKIGESGIGCTRVATYREKTFIGRMAKGFDGRGSHSSRAGLRVATTL
jgi:hypothetical protein